MTSRMIWYGMVRYGTVRYSTVRYGRVWYCFVISGPLKASRNKSIDTAYPMSKLEYGPGTIYAGFPSSQGFGVGDDHIPTFWSLLYGSGDPPMAA